MDPSINIDSDHRMLITDISTPTSKMARVNKKPNAKAHPKPDEKALTIPELKSVYLGKVVENLGIIDSNDKNEKIIKCMKKAADETLPKAKKNQPLKEIWKDDLELNLLLDRRKLCEIGTEEFKNATKLIKSRVRVLRNEKFKQKAAEIDEFTKHRQVDELYKSFKSDNTSFKEYKSTKKCDPSKLKEFFSKHFTSAPIKSDPFELTNAPPLLEKLKQISTESFINGAPDEIELIKTIKSLRMERHRMTYL